MRSIFASRILSFSDLRDFIVHNYGAIGWGAWGLATVYGLAYIGLFLAAAWAVFRRKALN